MDSDSDSGSVSDQDYETVAEGPYSTVYRSTDKGSTDGNTVIKRANALKKFTKEPHDIKKEILVLKSLDHSNVISIYRDWYDPSSDTIHFEMPYISYSLDRLLLSPSFSPNTPPIPAPVHPLLQTHSFRYLIKTISRQLFSALAYLHHSSRQIAHRDIKPSNILITHNAQVKLIDFGIAYNAIHLYNEEEVIWPETKDRMYFEVATGPYRAPELLLGSRAYDAFAVDLWSAGCVLAELFTPLRLYSPDSDDGIEDLDLAGRPPFVLPPFESVSHDLRPTEWERIPLFNADRGEIGLLWSIFKVRGTPTNELWPGFDDLLRTSVISFNVVPAVELGPLLPNLPRDGDEHTQGVDLLDNLLVYPPSKRLKAEDALRHIWLLDFK